MSTDKLLTGYIIFLAVLLIGLLVMVAPVLIYVTKEAWALL